jgi:hypothetical protein
MIKVYPTMESHLGLLKKPVILPEGHRDGVRSEATKVPISHLKNETLRCAQGDMI